MNPSRHTWRSGWERLISRSLPLCALLLLISVDLAWAVDANQPIHSYLRTRFATEEGLPYVLVEDMVQSRDGFLWLRINGRELARFDGRHFEMIEGVGHVLSLALAPDGDLWAGTVDDLRQIPAAALNQAGNLPAISYHPGPGPGSNVSSLHFARNGVLWVGTAAGLYRSDHGVFSQAIPGPYIVWIAEMANGHLWVSTRIGPMEWDGSRSILHPELEAQLGVKTADIFQVFEDSHGVTWFCTKNGVARRVGETIQKLEPWGPKEHQAFRVYEDPSGRIWIAKVEGLFQATAVGLELVAAGMNVRDMYGDRDGDLWVGTNGDGLYRFRERAVRMFTTADGLPGNVAMTVLATHDGVLWTGFNCGGISRFDGHSFHTYNEKDGLSNSCVVTLAEDIKHDLWIGTYGGGVFRFHDGKFTQYSKAQGLSSDSVICLIAASDGSIWLIGKGVSNIRDGRIRNYSEADGLSGRIILRVYEDRAAEIWASGIHGTDHLVGERFIRSPLFSNVEADPIGEDHFGRLYFSLGEHGGLFVVENNQAIQVAPEVHGDEMLETEQGDVWFTGVRILRVPQRDFDHPRQQDEPLNFEAFGLADGLATTQASGGYRVMALSRDSKLWIATNQGLAMIDLVRLPKTDRKPAIYMREVTVGRNSQAPGHELVLPAGTHHVELNFDAIEITSPEKVRLQYRLDGVDSEWLDAPTPARAIYSNISPGKHAFHVRACNRSGIWDRVGTVYQVIQQPYFYQTRWFLTATTAFGLLIILGLYQLRLRKVVERLNLRLEERVSERTRIARDLHDTLLQSFQGLMLRLQLVEDLLPEGKAKNQLEEALQRADQAIAEGRRAVYDLRSSTAVPTDLVQAVRSLGDEFATENSAAFHLVVEGAARNLNPIIRDELYIITREALRNAFTHARARHIEAEITYGERAFRLRIRDDGEGIPTQILEEGRPGHYGMSGMRERARQIGGKLELWSRAGAGTEIDLNIPGSVAYRTSVARPLFSLFSLFGRKTG